MQYSIGMGHAVGVFVRRWHQLFSWLPIIWIACGTFAAQISPNPIQSNPIRFSKSIYSKYIHVPKQRMFKPPQKNQLHQHAHPQVPKAHLPPHRLVTPWWWPHRWVIRPEAAAANAPCAVACEHPAMRRRSWVTQLGTAYRNAKHVDNSWGKNPNGNGKWMNMDLVTLIESVICSTLKFWG